MKMTIYITREQKGHGKHEYYWNEYRLEEGVIVKYRCYRRKFFDGNENTWDEDEKVLESWTIDNPNMPEWLRQYI